MHTARRDPAMGRVRRRGRRHRCDEERASQGLTGRPPIDVLSCWPSFPARDLLGDADLIPSGNIRVSVRHGLGNGGQAGVGVDAYREDEAAAARGTQTPRLPQVQRQCTSIPSGVERSASIESGPRRTRTPWRGHSTLNMALSPPFNPFRGGVRLLPDARIPSSPWYRANETKIGLIRGSTSRR